MSAETWFATVGFTTDTPIDPDTGFEALDHLTDHAGAMSLDPNGYGAEVSIAIDATTLLEAATAAQDVITAAFKGIAPVTIVKIDIKDEATMEKEVNEPTIPDLVGYAEIAKLAGVSRQRARQFGKIDGFPMAVVETAAGPLRLRASIEAWLRNRNTKSGRPRVHATA